MSYCIWFKSINHNGDERWYCGCQAGNGIASTYTGLHKVCPWCRKEVKDKDGK